jgi:TonB-linked SusC/RagA family outer membrane protein
MQFSFAQEKTVTGTVTDGKLPLSGANVVIKGSAKGVSADLDGKYSIKAKPGDVLVVSFSGYEKKSVTVGSANSYNVTLKESSKILEDVVFTGAVGIKKKRDAVTSTQQTVSNKELSLVSNPNVVQTLAGKVTGLQINTTSNGANPTTSIVLRGNRTITGNNQALVVIDGAISSANILQQMSSDMIESVNVIKGQQGSALYGEQGSNGVIVVTTKRGTSKSKIEVSFNSSVDFQNIAFLPMRQTTYGQGWVDGSYDFGFPNATDPRNGNSQFVPYENGAWGPAFSDPKWANTIVPMGLPQANGQILTTTWNSKGYDNIKAFFNTGIVTQNSITVNSGSEDGYAMFNYSRTSNDFVVQDDVLRRNAFLFKAGKKFGKLKVDGTVTYINQSTSETDSNLLYELLQVPTNIDLNQFRNSGTAHNWTSYALNPWQVIKQKRDDATSDNLGAVLKLEYNFGKHVTLLNTANVQLNSTKSTSHNDGFNEDYTADYSPYMLSVSGGPTALYSSLGGADMYEQSSFYISTNIGRSVYDDLMLNLDYKLTNSIGMKSNFGFNIQDNYRTVTTQGGTGLKIPGWYNIVNVIKPDNPSTLQNAYYQTRKVAGFANFDFDYNNYLFLNLTGRVENTSTVASSFFYPSAGISFVPTTAIEGMKDKKALNYLKLYANYSRTGNTTSVGPYATTDIAVVAAGFPYANNSSILAFRPRTNGVDPKITPEFVTSNEAGLQATLFNNRVTFDGSYYINTTDKLITNATTSTPSGLQTLLSNTGKLENKGYEFNIGLTPFKSEKGFNWNIKAGYTHYKTIVKDISDGVDEVNLLSSSSVGIFAVKGEEYPLIKGTTFATDSDGHVIVGANGVPQIDSTFKTLGKANPDFIINLSNTFSYKGISLSAVADYRSGHSIYSSTYNSMLFAGYTVDSAEFDRTQGYLFPNSVVNTSVPSTPVYATNTVAITPANLATYYSTLSSVGQNSIVDAATLKIREISLSYTIPSKFLKSTGITSCKFGINARNPFTIFLQNGKGMKNLGYTDPEASVSGNGIPGYSNVGQYPTTKTYGFNLNITF